MNQHLSFSSVPYNLTPISLMHIHYVAMSMSPALLLCIRCVLCLDLFGYALHVFVKFLSVITLIVLTQ